MVVVGGGGGGLNACLCGVMRRGCGGGGGGGGLNACPCGVMEGMWWWWGGGAQCVSVWCHEEGMWWWWGGGGAQCVSVWCHGGDVVVVGGGGGLPVSGSPVSPTGRGFVGARRVEPPVGRRGDWEWGQRVSPPGPFLPLGTTGHPPPPRPLKDWAKLSSGPSANHKFSLAPLAPMRLGQRISSKNSPPLGGRGGDEELDSLSPPRPTHPLPS